MAFLRLRRAVLAVLVSLTSVACATDPPLAEQEAGGEAAGRSSYVASCASCHGDSLQGTALGPPLAHPLYLPSRLSDGAFEEAVRRGVEPRHWELGTMPSQPGLPGQELDAIVAFVRSQQAAAFPGEP